MRFTRSRSAFGMMYEEDDGWYTKNVLWRWLPRG